jgi:hypothetical protein
MESKISEEPKFPMVNLLFSRLISISVMERFENSNPKSIVFAKVLMTLFKNTSIIDSGLLG